jgi:peptidase E
MSGHILAMGGGGILSPDSLLEDYLLELSGKARPRVGFLPTAGGERPEGIQWFYDAFAGRDCEPSHLELFGMPEEPAAWVAAQDVVYVCGGNTANALAIWRTHGFDQILHEAWEAGVVLTGWSAGMLCWFEAAVTDSFGPELQGMRDGLGFLPGSACPHYDGEAERRPVYTKLVAEGFPPGLAADDCVALRFDGTELAEVVTARPGAGAYRVSAEGEEPIEARPLFSGP